jgi:HAMP domain-containing protein
VSVLRLWKRVKILTPGSAGQHGARPDMAGRGAARLGNTVEPPMTHTDQEIEEAAERFNELTQTLEQELSDMQE